MAPRNAQRPAIRLATSLNDPRPPRPALVSSTADGAAATPASRALPASPATDAAKPASILAALERDLARKPVWLGDARPRSNLPWAGLIVALIVAGVALYGHARWSAQPPATVASSPSPPAKPASAAVPMIEVAARKSAEVGLPGASPVVVERANSSAAAPAEVAATLVEERASGKPIVAATSAPTTASGPVSTRKGETRTAEGARTGDGARPDDALTRSQRVATQPKVVAKATPPAKAAVSSAPAPDVVTADRPTSTKDLSDADVAVVKALIGARAPERSGEGASEQAETTSPIKASTASIGTLVRRCNELSAPGAAASCRRRICDGAWGKVDACPAQKSSNRR